MEETQNDTKFKPSAEHLVFADAYIKHNAHITNACAEIHMRREKYYKNYQKQPGFDVWLSEHCKEQVLRRRGQWYLIMEKFARLGSMPHLDRLLAISKEFVPEPNKGPGVNFNVNVHNHPQKQIVFTGIEELNADANDRGVADSENVHAIEGKAGNRCEETIQNT